MENIGLLLLKVGSSCLLKSQYRGKVGGKARLLYFGCWQVGEGRLLSKGGLPPTTTALAPTNNKRVRGFIAGGRSYLDKQHSQL